MAASDVATGLKCLCGQHSVVWRKYRTVWKLVPQNKAPYHGFNVCMDKDINVLAGPDYDRVRPSHP